MLLEIDHHSGLPIYRQVMDQIRQQIMAGHLQQGQQLISVRELAEQLKVNPMTISKAYALLEIEGLLERRRGIGLFIAQLPKARKIQTRANLLEDILKKAVLRAVQFDMTEDEIIQMVSQLYRKYDSKSRSSR